MATTLLLDIEGTVCPITFVKDVLFPYFLNKLPLVIAEVVFPLDKTAGGVSAILAQLPLDVQQSPETVVAYLRSLVEQDIKDPVLKALQGHVWTTGYDTQELKAPVYPDAIAAIRRFSRDVGKVYIYSSGSIKAQKLLFGYVDENGDSVNLNPDLSGYFDITTAGYKTEAASYSTILHEIGVSGAQVLFLSDNVNEVNAAIAAGMQASIVERPGNAALTAEERATHTVISTLDVLFTD